ncbi:addiction module toxin RelE [Pseudomonas sp. SWI6]|uniref:type II toxin-antitoxin system RelE/ParE family toxin n=1 Tax=Pseudomonas sp. SWI6 TaxID=2083051 RepID=UPI000CE5EC63|nr:type II toxin-antitoxin system RelE/ParE family toxin [Pseudomonas sp. SWI6]AVD81746.1 addiction module toxin RelE [Pseudomonas sp. SWI6]
MTWLVEFCDEFEPEFEAMDEAVQDELLAQLKLLERFGPELGRPQVDTLNDSKHANMKELRFKADDGVWRVAFAFDPERKAVLLVGGDKSGGSEKRFYKALIKNADARFDRHLSTLKKGKGNG